MPDEPGRPRKSPEEPGLPRTSPQLKGVLDEWLLVVLAALYTSTNWFGGLRIEREGRVSGFCTRSGREEGLDLVLGVGGKRAWILYHGWEGRPTSMLGRVDGLLGLVAGDPRVL